MTFYCQVQEQLADLHSRSKLAFETYSHMAMVLGCCRMSDMKQVITAMQSGCCCKTHSAAGIEEEQLKSNYRLVASSGKASLL